MTIFIPEHPIGYEALQINTEWTEVDHRSTYRDMQKTISFWKENDIRQHLVYSSFAPNDQSFSHQIVPFKDAGNIITRFFRQLIVLWRVTFGGSNLSQEERDRQGLKYSTLLDGTAPISSDPTTKLFRHCNFCNSRFERQKVAEGKLVRVSYNYAPIGLGGERLHFLITPELHKKTFSDLTEDEYVDTMDQAKHLIDTLSKTREIVKVHFLHKSGRDAGQTVPHWHLHVIVQTTPLQGILGSLTVFKNMLGFGATPLKDNVLLPIVKGYKDELNDNPLEVAQ